MMWELYRLDQVHYAHVQLQGSQSVAVADRQKLVDFPVMFLYQPR